MFLNIYIPFVLFSRSLSVSVLSLSLSFPLFLSLSLCLSLCVSVQGHPEGSAGGQGAAEDHAKEPAVLLLRPAAGAGGGAPLDEAGGPALRHQRQGETPHVSGEGGR